MSFEKAWELLKMPIVPHSVTTNEDGTDWEGKFEDPVTGEILPIIGRLDAPGATRGEAHIAPHLPSPSWMNSRASVYFDRDEFEEDISDYDTFLHPTDLGTKTAYQRRGYATALMDLIAQIVQQEHNEKMFESSAQSYDAERFVEAMSDRFAEDEKGHRYWVGRNDLMEKSGDLLKMPLLRDTVEEIHPNRYTALFQDRENKELLQMIADSGEYGDYGMEIQVRDIPKDKRVALSAFRGYPEQKGWWHSSDNFVSTPYRRKGISTAMYDLMNLIIQRRGQKGLKPNERRTSEGRMFWRGDHEWPKEGRYE